MINEWPLDLHNSAVTTNDRRTTEERITFIPQLLCWTRFKANQSFRIYIMRPDPPSNSSEASSYARGDAVYFFRNGKRVLLVSPADSCNYKAEISVSSKVDGESALSCLREGVAMVVRDTRCVFPPCLTSNRIISFLTGLGTKQFRSKTRLRMRLIRSLIVI